uniref:RNA-directed DNA polymerase n=1 Tax=Phytophthora ramorum TaxID=164328 RepID=H3H7X8_PHYRM
MKIRHRCNVTGESFEGVVATVKGSVEPAVLKTLATYVLKKPVEDVDDAEILAQVQKRCKSLKNAFIPDVTTLFRKQLKMDMTVDDCDTRVFKYFQAFTKIVEDNGLQALIGSGDVTSLGYKDRMKARCSILVENIQPTMLREQIERLIKYERRDCKTNDATLFDLILKHARVQQRFHSQAGERTTPQSRAQAPQQQSKRMQKSAKPSHPAGVKKVRTPPRNGCLVCRGPHWLDECPTATSEQRADALAKLRAAKNARQESVQSKAVLATARPNMVRVNGMVDIPYVPYSGADRAMISRSVVASLAEFSPDLKLSKLEAPVAVYLAGGRRIECLEKATVALELVTAAGPVHMRDVVCLVLDSDMEELLLGNDVMKSLGIDVERMIEQLTGASLLEEKDEFPVGDELIPANSGEDGVLDQLVDEALANGMPGEHVDRLRSLVHEHGDVFRERLGDDPPALVEPLKVTLTDDAVSFCCKPRKYAPLQSAFLREYTAELEKRGFIRKNNAAKWACAAVPVRKPGSQTEFRITIDYRPVNKVTVPIAGAMPNLAVVSSSVRGARCFAKFDMIKGFWQLPLDVDSQELMSFMTEDTVYTPTRPQGAVDSAIHFQMQMQDAMAPMLQRNALVWVDDVIIFAPTVEEFLQALKEFFIILRDRRLKLSAAKSSLFQLEALWCGKLISGSGVHHDSERVDALSALPVPSTVAELQYFVCASNWLHDSLPDYARVVAPLQERLGMERKRIGRRNKNALNVAVTLTEAEVTSYNEVKTLIKASVQLVFPSPTSELVVMTDASLTGWSIVVTEVQAWDDSLPVDKQQHRMILCKGGTFKDSQLNWAIVEKEAFPIVKACTDLEYLLQRERGFKLFCDHANLIYIFAPHVELKKHVRDRLQRWAMRLCGLRFTIEHVAGETNAWADIISR